MDESIRVNKIRSNVYSYDTSMLLYLSSHLLYSLVHTLCKYCSTCELFIILCIH